MGFRIAATALALATAGCALVPEPTSLPELAAVPRAFEMSGRIAVREGQRNDIARLRWTHAASGDLWIVASPLGNEVARIESDARGAMLTQAGAPPQQADSFAQLAQALVGVPIEPATLAAWLHGRESAGSLSGWRVVLDETQQAGAVRIARRLTATRADTVVRLVVDDYRLVPE